MDPEGPRTIADISALSYEDKHVLARKALVHQTPDVQVNVYVLEPGGRIPAHRHSASWDITFVIAGEIEVRFIDGETERRVRCGRDAMNLVPPGTLHEISNQSPSTPARFLLVQSPSHSFDFVRA